MKKIVLSCLSLACLPILAAQTTFPPVTNGTWAYNLPGDMLPTQAPLIKIYNDSAADASRRIMSIFSYGSDMECSDSPGVAPCDPNNLSFFYSSKNPKGPNGVQNTRHYHDYLVKAYPDIQMLPIVDGRTDAGGYLAGFNELSEPLARRYADIVAAQVCNDPNVAGIQFDIEPFNMSSKNGQYYFFDQISKDFSSTPCVDEAHPNGRYFSAFGFAEDINQNVADIFSKPNAIFVDSLYDLPAIGGAPGGTPSAPAAYDGYLVTELQTLLKTANQYNINFQVAIPASASAHEFESYINKDGKAIQGYPQVQYVTIVLDELNNLKVRADAHFKGVDVWTFNSDNKWGGGTLFPSSPPADVLNKLATDL